MTTNPAANVSSSFFMLNASEVVAVCALFVAVLAFIATVWQGAIARRHARLSVRPHLDRHEARTSTERMDICIVNNGLGPAIIDRILVGLPGCPPTEQDKAYARRLLAETSKFTSDCVFKMITANTPIQAGQSVALVSLTVDIEDDVKLQDALRFLAGFSFEIRYHSLYNEPLLLRRNPE